LKGTLTTSIAAPSRKRSALRCVALPMPIEAALSAPGFDLAAATSSFTERMPFAGAMTRTFDDDRPARAPRGPAAVIYTPSLLEGSMTFIRSQAEALVHHEPVYAGAHRVSGIELPPERTYVVNPRTPLGVASGYLRLVRDGRVPTSTDPVVLLDRALESLRAISRLCMDADRWLNEAPVSRPAATSSSQLLSVLSSELATRNIMLQGVDDVPARQLLVAGDAAELADAVVEVLSAAARATPCRQYA